MTKVRTWAMTKLENFATAEISSRPLAIIRIFASLILIHEFSGMLASYRVDDSVISLASSWVVLLSLGFGLVGYRTRWAFGLMTLGFAVLHLYYGFHLRDYSLGKPTQVFQIIGLLWLTPSGRSLSIDRYLAVVRAAKAGEDPPPERMPWWQLELFLLEICSIYFWAAQNKLDPAWFRGERMERYYVEWYGSSDSFVYSPTPVHWGAMANAWMTTILEVILAFGLLIRRIRPWVWIGGVALHVGIMFMFSVPFFTLMMLTVLIAALPPAWLHGLIDDLCA
jgi:hypothetical protein